MRNRQRVYKLFIAITFLLFCSLISNAQNFKLGFDLEGHRISINEGRGVLSTEGIPVAYHLVTMINPTNETSVQLRIGKTLHAEFWGWEFGLSGKYNFYKRVYITAGILEHSNEGGIGSNTWGTKFASIWMLHAGLGVDVTSVISVDLNYYKSVSQKQIGSSGKHLYTFDSMIGLKFIFAWEL